MAVEKILLEFDADIKALRSDMNQVKSQLGDVEKQGNKTTSQLSSGFKRVGAAIGAAFSVQVLIQFTKKSLELYDIQAKAEASLLQALRGREDIQKRLILQAQQLQKVTLFGDEATIQAQAMLAKFGMQEAQIKRLIPLIQDYATISGQDLVSAADMVARSIATSTNALSRYGIEINGAVGSAERLESAISSLNEKAGGQAIAAAEAGIGELQQLQMAWGDFAEAIGSYIYPRLSDLIGAGTKLVKILKLSLGPGGLLKLPSAWDEATIAADKYNREQQKFIDYYEENKDVFGGLAEAGEAYGEFLDEQTERIKSQTDENGKLTQAQMIQLGVLDVAKQALSDYLEQMNSKITIPTEKATKATLDLSESLDKLPKLVDKVYDPFREATTLMDKFREAAEGIVDTNLDEFYLRLGLAISEADDANIEFFKSILDGQADEALNKQREIAAFYDIAGSSIDFFSTMSSQATERYLQDLQKQLDAGKITQEQFDRERKKELREQAKDTRALAVFDIVLNTARAVMSFLAQPTPNVPGSIAAGVAGALQLATVITQPLPAFATGTVDLKGEGTETSDSIIARLSKGESVITAKGTKQDKALFEAANKLQLEEYINKNYVLPALVKVQKDKADMFDDYRLYMSLQNMKKSDKENTDKIVRAIKTEYTNNRRYWA